jgi:hypothetical protein
MDEGNQKLCIHSDCRGLYSKPDCYCCAKKKEACFPELDECTARCPIITSNNVIWYMGSCVCIMGTKWIQSECTKCCSIVFSPNHDYINLLEYWGTLKNKSIKFRTPKRRLVLELRWIHSITNNLKVDQFMHARARVAPFALAYVIHDDPRGFIITILSNMD